MFIGNCKCKIRLIAKNLPYRLARRLSPTLNDKKLKKPKKTLDNVKKGDTLLISDKKQLISLLFKAVRHDINFCIER